MIGIAFVGLCMLIGLASSEVSHDYECDLSNLNKVTYYGNNLECLDGTICNHKYKVLLRETKPRPCVAPKEICDYSCDAKDTSVVFINLVKFVCKDNEQCNSKKTSCQICEVKPCSKQAYKCIDDSTVQLLLGDYKMSCKSDEICNKDNEQPCSPCIPKPNPGPAPGNPESGIKRRIGMRSILSQPFYA